LWLCRVLIGGFGQYTLWYFRLIKLNLSRKFQFAIQILRSALLLPTPRFASLLLAACYLLPATFLILFYFYPLASILSLSFAPEGRVDLSALQQLAGHYYLKTLWFTIWQATLSTLLTLGLGLPAAYVFARYRFFGKTLWRSLTTIPFVLPTVVVATAFTALLGPKGFVNQTLMQFFRLDAPPIQLQHTVTIILLAHIFYNYTIVLRLVGGFWANLNPNMAEAGQMLGASPWRAVRYITLPLLAPAIGAAALLIFIFSFTSFGVILILGGPRFATLEVEIYRQAVNLFNLPVAAALSLIQIIFIFAFMLTYTRLQALTSRPLSLQSQQFIQRNPQNWREHLLVWTNIGFMFILLGIPLATLALRSVTIAGGFSLTYYQALFTESPQRQSLFFVPPTEGITNSLVFAISTVILAIFLGLLVSIALTAKQKTPSNNSITNYQLPITNYQLSIITLKPLFDSIFMLPLATSAVTLGFGYIITLNKPPLNLRTSWVLIVIAHTLVALPFVIRSLLPALRSIQPALREAAAVLGASPLRVWQHIDLPIGSRALVVGAVFAFTISMGEFGATLFIARPNTPTLPIAIFRFLSQPGALNYGQALALSTLLMLVCAIGFVAIERFRVGDSGF
jgi:thiamine transport system permease protein